MVVVASAAVSVFSVRRSEPFYRGRYLSDWVTLGASSESSPIPIWKREAVQSAGTNAIPWLIRRIGYQPSRGGLMLDKIGSTVFSTESFTARKTARADGAASAFALLGAEAESALPALVRLLNHATPNAGGDRAAKALARLGRVGARSLVSRLTNESAIVRERAANGIGLLTADADRSTSALIHALKDTSPCVAVAAATAICRLEVEPKLAVSALASCFYDARPDVRRSAAAALEQFRVEAGPAIPALRAALDDPDTQVRAAATNAICAVVGATPEELADPRYRGLDRW